MDWNVEAITPRAGRGRDAAIGDRILAAASRHLSAHGYEGMSLAAVAQEAGTTRQALYRRWPTKSDLAAAVVAAIGSPEPTQAADPQPFGALVAELTGFARDVSAPGRMSLVGAMLQETADASVVERYRARVIAPRRRRITAILREAQDRGLVGTGADIPVAVTMCTGSWYGRALAGDPVPPDWPARTAALVWRALGGEPPPAA